jgi:hypothetical protein
MDRTPFSDAVDPTPDAFSDGLAPQRAAAGRIVAWLHAKADQLEVVPPDFGAEDPVDPGDGAAVRREWLRLLRRWMDNNPEQMLALKVGLGVLAIALIVMVAFVRSMS